MYRYALLVVVGLLVCCVFFVSLSPSGGQETKAEPGVEQVKIFTQSIGGLGDPYYGSARLQQSMNDWLEKERPDITRVLQTAQGGMVTVFYKKKK